MNNTFLFVLRVLGAIVIVSFFVDTCTSHAFFRRPIAYQVGTVPVTLARDAAAAQACAPTAQRITKTRAPQSRSTSCGSVQTVVEPLYVREPAPLRIRPLLPGVEVVVRRRLLRPRIRYDELYAPQWAAEVPVLQGEPIYGARRVPLLNILGLGLWFGGW